MKKQDYQKPTLEEFILLEIFRRKNCIACFRDDPKRPSISELTEAVKPSVPLSNVHDGKTHALVHIEVMHIHSTLEAFNKLLY